MNSAELSWFKSSYSSSEGGNCIEVAYDWHKSSYSDAEGGNCVEVAVHPTTIHVRDSTNLTGPQLAVTPEAWSAFLNEATTG
ncbi:DUF397 domain-containing protein [Streptomyces sp. NPDC048717]|uniref:DUF397 domain-containing protein n=1 Tax=Streptomyces sp. NPDC048717 TaxID=3154928 RepID=UPI0034193EF3